MAEQRPKPAPNVAGTILMGSILSGAVIIAALGAFLPSLIGLSGTPAIVIPLVFYAIAAIDVGIAFWLRAKLKAARPQSGDVVRRQ